MKQQTDSHKDNFELYHNIDGILLKQIIAYQEITLSNIISFRSCLPSIDELNSWLELGYDFDYEKNISLCKKLDNIINLTAKMENDICIPIHDDVYKNSLDLLKKASKFYKSEEETNIPHHQKQKFFEENKRYIFKNNSRLR